MAKQKDLSIETLRGFAIILMVAGHVIGEEPTNGMQVSDDSWFRHLYYSLAFFRMPLFTVISGYVYTLRPVEPDASMTFLQGKARRILIPLVSVATLEFLMRMAVPGVDKSHELGDFWKIYFFPFDHFWFLQALFVTFLAITLLERLQAMRTVGRWVLVLIGTLLLVRFSPLPTSFLSYPSFLYLFPFFVCGIGLGRFPETLRRWRVMGPTLALFVLAIVWQQGAWYGWDLPLLDSLDTSSRRAALGMTVGLTGCLVAFRFRWRTTWLARLGSYSFGIYLFHVFATAGSRILSGRLLDLSAGLPLFLLSLGAGLVFPIVVERTLIRFNLTRLGILGLRAKPSGRPTTPTSATTDRRLGADSEPRSYAVASASARTS